MRWMLSGVLGVALVAASTTGPQSTRYFVQTAPPSALPLRLLGRSHLSLITDFAWIRAIGVTVNMKVPADGKALLKWCGLVTDLDPKFLYPYLLGGLLAPMTFATRDYNVEEANALMEKGIANIPSDHRLYLYLSYNQLHLQHDLQAAARTLRRGALVPGAPAFMGPLATRLLAQANDFDAARAFTDELAQQSSDPEMREFLARRKLEIERDQHLLLLQSAVDSFKRTRGSLPHSLMQLLAEGFIGELPPDPLGGEFQLASDGQVVAPSGSRLQYHQPPKE